MSFQTGYDDTKLFAFNLATRSCTREIPLGGNDRMRFLNRLDAHRVVYTQTNKTLTVLNVREGRPERVLKQALSEVAGDPESGRVYAWSGRNMFVLDADGTLHEPVETLAVSQAQVVRGQLVVGAKSGAVAIIGRRS